ncbi:hypothetical protein [Streptomyces triticiradicis]|uniref:Uncharacterized protein n=1 Tax=Streptomyces triticiradicis TaxID=2651189 RepID=A0A7J5DEY9_9ACTN|nr:hypothetical protein [Streptomyces triticiradicis]KAB1987441.1 hypothetical protein F8144_17065 [Streptomyces triticiradicis]
MLNELWKGISGKLAERFMALAIPAVLFWTTGLAAYAWSDGGPADLRHAAHRALAQPAAVQFILVTASLAVVTASAFAVAQMGTPALRLLAGQWPPILRPLREHRLSWHRARAEGWEEQWQRLHEKVENGTADAGELERSLELDQRLRGYPTDRARTLPTGVGNLLRATELRLVNRYGLDVVRCWAALWMVLPDNARTELAAARASLDSAVRSLLWAVLTLCWLPLAWPVALLSGLVTTTFLFVVLPNRAALYTDVLEAVVHVHRGKLYEALRWPLPGTPAAEPASGAALTAYLWRGLESDQLQFRPS